MCERYTKNLKHPLVKTAAQRQVDIRNQQGRARNTIRDLVAEVALLQAQDEILTYFIGQSTELDPNAREIALNQLDRLFHGEPDGRLPLQMPYRISLTPDEEQEDADQATQDG